jgi:hypothetical protein
MKKLKKHIEKMQFVKVYITDKKEQGLTHFEGIIFNQNDNFIYMCDLSDFNYDGFVIIRKEDISHIKRSENEKFFNRILKGEKIIRDIKRRKEYLDFDLDDMKHMFGQLKKMEIATIVECLYASEESFQIGPIVKCKENKMKIDYFNSRGEFELEPVSIKYKDITFFRIDSPYASLFFKYAELPELKAEKNSKSKKVKSEKKVAKSEMTDKQLDKKVKKKKEPVVEKSKKVKNDKKSKKKKYEKPKNVQRLTLVV